MKRPTNLGRVMQLRNFRDYIHSRLNLRANDWMLHNRRTHFFCESWFPIRLRLTCGKLLLYKNDNSIEVQVMSSILDMSEQIFVMRHAHVLVLNHSKDKTCALFLPDHATLIVVNSQRARQTTSLDWEFWNNYPLLKTHLVTGRNLTAQQQALSYIVEEEYSRLLLSSSSSETKREKRLKMSSSTVAWIQERPPVTRVHCMGESRYHDGLSVSIVSF
jgi:hypothetical protein